MDRRPITICGFGDPQSVMIGLTEAWCELYPYPRAREEFSGHSLLFVPMFAEGEIIVDGEPRPAGSGLLSQRTVVTPEGVTLYGYPLACIGQRVGFEFGGGYVNFARTNGLAGTRWAVTYTYYDGDRDGKKLAELLFNGMSSAWAFPGLRAVAATADEAERLP